jgi:hypothetical protein
MQESLDGLRGIDDSLQANFIAKTTVGVLGEHQV